MFKKSALSMYVCIGNMYVYYKFCWYKGCIEHNFKSITKYTIFFIINFIKSTDSQRMLMLILPKSREANLVLQLISILETFMLFDIFTHTKKWNSKDVIISPVHQWHEQLLCLIYNSTFLNWDNQQNNKSSSSL